MKTRGWTRAAATAVVAWVALVGAGVQAQGSAAAPAPAAVPAGSKFLAPGFTGLAPSARVLLMPVDVELFSLSAGGVAEPKADWTAAARTHMKAAVLQRREALRLDAVEISETEADDFAEQVGLHAAVANSIALHHGLGGVWSLPTKDGQLLWSFGDAMAPLAAKTGARYALFMWMRDSYASAERKAVMFGMALLGVGLTGGVQIGYASLVDLHSGEVVWFNHLARGYGDLREAGPAAESIGALLTQFPAGR